MRLGRIFRILRLRSAFAVAAAGMAIVVGPVTTAAPAQAVTPDQAAKAVQVAYTVYKQFLGGGLSLSQATNQIINAIQEAKEEIIAELLKVTDTTVKACSRNAVNNLPTFPSRSADTKDAWAYDARHCVELARAAIENASYSTNDQKAVIDSFGFALNAAGPVALVESAAVNVAPATRDAIITSLVAGNTKLAVSPNGGKLNPSCTATVLHEGNIPEEVILTCWAFNGHMGRDFTYTNQQYNFDQAKREAAVNTAYNVAKNALPVLNNM